jgi:hypothetical protein
MKKQLPALLVIVMVLVLTACNGFSAAPTATPTASPEPTQTFTPIPSATATATATATRTPIPPTATPEAEGFSMPEGEPQSDWEGLPVMPGAIAGEGDDKGYIFTTAASVEEIQAYYGQAMANLGWSLMANGEGENGSLMMIFMDSQAGIASIAVFSQDGVQFVVLTQ